MKIKIFLRHLVIIFFVFANIHFANCEVFTNKEATFSLNLPEGFAILMQEGDDSFHFKHKQLPIDVVVRIYQIDRYKDVKSTTNAVYAQLNAQGNNEDFIWRYTNCNIGNFAFNENKYKGWSLSVKLPLNKGYFVILAYTQQEFESKLNGFLVSIIDSLCIDRGSYYSAGPITTYAYPEETTKKQILNIDGIEIESYLNTIDEDANRFVIEREYNILKMYSNSSMLNAAWKRYYKMIYKDSYYRLRKVAFDIYNELYPKVQEKHPQNTDFFFVQKLLNWVQDFKYVRNFQNSDFSPMPVVLANGGSDCDSRAMLLAILLNQMNYKTMVFVSPEYKHSFFGVNIDGKGAKLYVAETPYLLGETTTKVDLGLVPQDMSDSTKWIPMLD